MDVCVILMGLLRKVNVLWFHLVLDDFVAHRASQRPRLICATHQLTHVITAATPGHRSPASSPGSGTHAALREDSMGLRS